MRSVDAAATVASVLPTERYLTALRAEVDLIIDALAGRDGQPPALRSAAVPGCPDWDVLQLVAHTGRVHRWAASVVAQALPTRPHRQDVPPELDDPADLPDWFAEGGQELLLALADAPEDVQAWRLFDFPLPARLFWARRQTHETVVHRVDLQAARAERPLTDAEAQIPDDLALDGVDELLSLFATSPRAGLRTTTPAVITVAPDGTDRTWSVRTGPDTAPELITDVPAPDLRLSGSPAAVYLGLWNRLGGADGTGDGLRVEGDVDLWRQWRATVHV
ncbi:maleylpyruvate isomerase family mycothiol-dependent enzyme [Nakamurella leprariae]|uniref:Maleylpyruvate isomerase family mycothiol-dependent enzyme n=1 Tax=Nakamurella leprariae TaxID=2803911 RepID=A0A939BYJ0_9ACTN|nr:maleylpyruvate isomerase family mycothiol-dependent enzyme [Nakamurella leprariae]MBM9466676.1 maleylpyruvate isomerase family mycothiol-dependent enzyme [Nakamurella leprariae]